MPLFLYYIVGKDLELDGGVQGQKLRLQIQAHVVLLLAVLIPGTAEAPKEDRKSVV